MRTPLSYLREMRALEWALVAAVFVMAVQLFPGFFSAITSPIWSALDIREWTRLTWIVLNVAAVLTLCAIRFVPQLSESLQLRRAASQKNREMQIKQQQMHERRQRIESIREGRRRRQF